MLELRVATAGPWVTVVLDGLDGYLLDESAVHSRLAEWLDDEARISSELPISAALH